MVCPKCGMEVVGKRSHCRHCGAPIPAELGGDRPDPIFDDEYDWLHAEELKAAAEGKPIELPVAPPAPSAEPEKSGKRSMLLPVLLCAAALVLLVSAALLSRGARRQGAEVEYSSPAETPAAVVTPSPEPSASPVPETPEPTPEATPEPTPAVSEYLLPESDSRYLTAADLEGLTQEQCCLARNEIYARHGRSFNTGAISRYFTGKSWYSASVSAERFSDSVLNSFEIANIAFIMQYESDKWGGSYY